MTALPRLVRLLRRRPAPGVTRHAGTARRTGWLGACGLALALPLALPAWAGDDARAWLARIRAAAQVASYEGTLVYSGNGALSSSRVQHFRVGRDTFEQLEALDGRQQRILRHNTAVHTQWPQTRLLVIEQRETMAAWSTTPQTVDPQALSQYTLRREGRSRVAGRDTEVFVLEPRDALRYAQRLWADTASGLMLRADVLAPGGEGRGVIESTAFSQIDIGVPPQPDALLQAMRETQGWRVVRPQQRATTLPAEGWHLARPVPGFRLAGCVRRGLQPEGEPVVQAVFADGLTHVSLFIERFQPERHREEVRAKMGATATLMQRRGEHWLTVVGDVPPATLQRIADSVEPQR